MRKGGDIMKMEGSKKLLTKFFIYAILTVLIQIIQFEEVIG